MAYDATKMKDWQISEAAEKNMPTPEEWGEKLGLKKDEIIPATLKRKDTLPETKSPMKAFIFPEMSKSWKLPALIKGNFSVTHC